MDNQMKRVEVLEWMRSFCSLVRIQHEVESPATQAERLIDHIH
jgi:hypothetical protein